MGLALTGCKNQGTGLMDANSTESICPPDGCSVLDPDPAQVSISNTGKSNLYLPPVVVNSAVVDGVEIGGDCYASTYPKNRIEVEVSKAGNRVQLGANDVWSARKEGTATATCVNGRFGFSINGARLPSGATYRIDVSMIGIDDQNREFRNSNAGFFSVSVSR